MAGGKRVSEAQKEVVRGVVKAGASVAKDEAKEAAAAAAEKSKEAAGAIGNKLKMMDRFKKFKITLSSLAILQVMMCMIGNAIFLNEIANSATSTTVTVTSSVCGSSTSGSQAALFFILHLYSFVFGLLIVICELGNMKVPGAKLIFKEFHVMKSWVTRGLVLSFIGISTASLYVPSANGATTIYNQVFGWGLFVYGLVYASMRIACVKQYLENEAKGLYDTDKEDDDEKYQQMQEMEEGGAGVEEDPEPEPEPPVNKPRAATVKAASKLKKQNSRRTKSTS